MCTFSLSNILHDPKKYDYFSCTATPLVLQIPIYTYMHVLLARVIVAKENLSNLCLPAS
jgi:hypothetical protein